MLSFGAATVLQPHPRPCARRPRHPSEARRLPQAHRETGAAAAIASRRL